MYKNDGKITFTKHLYFKKHCEHNNFEIQYQWMNKYKHNLEFHTSHFT